MKVYLRLDVQKEEEMKEEMKEIGIALLILLPFFVAVAACTLIFVFLIALHPTWFLLFFPCYFVGIRGSIYLLER